MKPFIPILLALAIILQSFSSFVIMAGYELNKAAITKKFCENKDKPKMKCNGKCHMRKQLQAEKKKEQSPVSPIKEKNNILQYAQVNSEFEFTSLSNKLNYSNYYIVAELPEISFSFFHPPTC